MANEFDTGKAVIDIGLGVADTLYKVAELVTTINQYRMSKEKTKWMEEELEVIRAERIKKNTEYILGRKGKDAIQFEKIKAKFQKDLMEIKSAQ